VTPAGRDSDRALAHQGHYAGAVSRLLAFLADSAFVSILYAAALGLVTAAVDVATPWTLDFSKESWFTLLLYFGWWGIYLGNGWLLRSKSPGMALLGLRIVRADGSDLDQRHALIRLIAFPLGFLTFGAGFLGIIFGKTRSAIYDRIANTAVVYHWDAESAKIRELARQRQEAVAAEHNAAAETADVPVQSPG
jgi:uncharacterized RDD family membrane protein YckC